MVSPGDDYEVVERDGRPDGVIPAEEYRILRLTHDWHDSPGRVRTSPEEFLAVSGLTPGEQQVMRERHGLSGLA